MTFAGVRLAEISESRAYKDIITIGHQEGVQEGLREGKPDEALALVLRLLNRRLGGLGEERLTTLRQLSTEDLEALAEALLDFQSEGDLEEWLVGRQLG